MAQNLEYTLIKRRGLKNITLRVNSQGVKMYAPKYTPQRLINAFWNQHKDKLPTVVPSLQKSSEDYAERKEVARKILLPLVAEWAHIMGLTHNRVAIKNTTSRWGSCSTKKNLNFSYKVAFLPDNLREYVIIHELAHLVHMNHSQDFWDEVGKYCPEYSQLRTTLQNHRLR